MNTKGNFLVWGIFTLLFIGFVIGALSVKLWKESIDYDCLTDKVEYALENPKEASFGYFWSNSTISYINWLYEYKEPKSRLLLKAVLIHSIGECKQ